MWELLQGLFQYFYIPLYGITLIVALGKYSKYFDTPLKYLPILFLYTLTTETLGLLIWKFPDFSLALNEFYDDNRWLIYNIYGIFYFLYLHYIFRNYISNRSHKQLILLLGALFLLATLINPFLQNFMLDSQFYAYVIGSLGIICCVVLYYQQLTKLYRPGFYKKDLLFWVGLGLLVFHSGYLPIKIIRFANQLNGVTEGPYLRPIHLVLILIMYLCFIIGFLNMGKVRTAEHI